MQNDDTKKLPAGWFGLVFIGGIAFTKLFRINDPLFIFGVLSALFLLWNCRKGALRFSLTDTVILVLWGYQLVNLFSSIEPVSGFFAIRTLTFCIIFYFLLRTVLDSSAKIEKFVYMLCVFIALLCAVATVTFFLFRSACVYVGFNSLYDFRHLYKPFGYLSNVWGTLLIGFTGIVLFALHLGKQGKVKSVFLILLLGLLLWNIVISFSRGVYLALASLLLSYGVYLVFFAIDRRRKILTVAVLTFLLFIAGFVHRQDVVKTLQFNRSLSQQRSIAGRMDAISSSYELFKASPLTGTGAGTYQQVINEYRYEDDDIGFTSFAPNGYIQLVVEQGIAGLVLWGLLFVSVFVEIFRKRKNSQASMILFILLTAILIREATFSVLLGSLGLQLLLFTALAVFQFTDLTDFKNLSGLKLGLCFPVIALISSLLIFGYSLYYMHDEQNNRKALSEMKAGRPDDAETYILKTSERTPYLINRFLVYDELYRKTHNTEYLDRAENYLQKAALKNPHDMTLTYYQASVLREKGQYEAALSVLTELTQRFPNKSLYQLSVFDLLYKNGQQEKAFPYLLQAVKIAPDLWDSAYLENIFLNDPALKELLKNKLLQNIFTDKDSNDPVLLAKNGKIFLSSGLNKEAKPCLEKAILLLPNLIYPHYYLSQIEASQQNFEQSDIYLKQFVFLRNNSLSKHVIDETVRSGEFEKLSIRRKQIIDHSYTVKFQTWYRSSTILKQLIL
ncbi:MAG: O-antigen ligase family protein [Prevotellaceae bacterium]|jgi:O-antigen ligase|nr:O-antigen ligase family protein [Prevotellaceae bacterium]